MEWTKYKEPCPVCDEPLLTDGVQKACPNNCASPQLLDESDRRDVLHRKRLEKAGRK